MRLFRNGSVLVALLAMAAATRPALCAPQPRDGLRPEVLETFLRMRVVAAVLDTQAVELTYPAYPDVHATDVPAIDRRRLMVSYRES